MPNEVDETSPQPRFQTEENKSDASVALELLLDVKSQFSRFDKTDDSRITREELISGLQKNSTRTAEDHLLKNFGRLSGGKSAISKADIDREILSNLSIAIEESAGKSELDFELRSSIARWTEMSSNKKPIDLQNQINNALSGTGIQMHIQKWKSVNLFVETVPGSTFTFLEGKKVLDRFSLVKTEDARLSLFEGKSTKNGITILDKVNPRDSYNNGWTDNMANLRALEHLMNDQIIAKDGEFSLEAMTKYRGKNQEQKYAQYFLQYNFGKLAPKDGKALSVSKEDLRIEMEEKLSLLIANSLSQSKPENSELIDRFLRTTLQDEYVGLSHTLANTLNEALDKQGFKATISPITDRSKSSRTLSIESKPDSQKRKVINFLRQDPDLSYRGYENSATAPFGSR